MFLVNKIMKISPKFQYQLVFWFYTLFLIWPLLILVILAIINPFWFRDRMIRYTETFADKLSKFRDKMPYVKYFHDKANLFEIIKR